MKRTRTSKSKRSKQRLLHCREFFHCDPERQKECLLEDVGSTPCWLVDVACCRMPQDAARPLSIKKVICKHCAFYIYVHTKTR